MELLKAAAAWSPGEVEEREAELVAAAGLVLAADARVAAITQVAAIKIMAKLAPRVPVSKLEATVVHPTLAAIRMFLEDVSDAMDTNSGDMEVMRNLLELESQLLEPALALVVLAVQQQGLGVVEVPSLPRLLPAILAAATATVSKVPAGLAEEAHLVRQAADAVQAAFLRGEAGCTSPAPPQHLHWRSSSESEEQEVSLQEVEGMPQHQGVRSTSRGSRDRRSRSGTRSRSRSGPWRSRSRPGARRSRSRSGARRSRSRSGGRRSRSRSGGRRSRRRRSRVRCLSKEEKDELAEDIAQRVFRMKEEKEERVKYEAEKSEHWEKGADFLICKACSAYKDQPNLPPEMSKLKQGLTGMVARNRNGRKIPEGEVRRRVKEHEGTNFHLWCVRRAKEDEKSSKTYEEENREAGLLVIKAYLKTATEGGSGQDFLRLVDFTHLIPGVLKSQKNNSRPAFFRLRDDCFELVTERVRERFRRGEINEFSCTLDKVTVQSRSFTVLLTFFFSNGKIFCLLNGLLSMEQGDYNSPGTAKMIADCLKDTLGLTSSQLARTLLHIR